MERGRSPQDGFGILSARPPCGVLAGALAASLMAIPQALFIADAVALLALGQAATLSGLSWPVLLAGLAATILIRQGLDAWAGRAAALAAIASKAEIQRRFLAVTARWSPLAAGRPAAGDLASTVVDRVDTLDAWLTRYPLARLRMGVVPLAIAAVVFPVSWAAGLVLLAAGPIIPVFMSLIGARAQAVSRSQLDEAGSLTGLLLDRLRGLETLRVLRAAPAVADGIAAAGERVRAATMRVLAVAFLSSAVLEFFAAVGVALTAVLIGFRLIGWIDWGGEVSLAGGLFVLILAPDFFQPLREFAAAYHDRAAALALAERAQEVFGARREVIVGAAEVAPVDGGAEAPGLTVRGLTARSASGATLIREIDLSVAPGEHVALLGASGAGKSTLLAAVAGLITPAEGTVVIGDRTLDPGTAEMLRRNMTWIGQEPFVLAASLARNLATSGQPASPAALQEYLVAARLDGVVAALPSGAATPLGETGLGLSRGELRRLTIVRSMLQQRGLVLADEPTADLDMPNAEAVADALIAAAQGRTLLVATHDEALAARMDRVVRLAGGRLAGGPA